MNEVALAGGRGPLSLASAEAGRLLALLLPLALLGGALGSQYIGGLMPCEMCYWQRWPHGAAIVLAALAFIKPAAAKPSRTCTLLAAAAIALSGAIGVYHSGVELGLWQGFTSCTAVGAVTLEDIMAAPLVRCDQVQWSFLGLSMAAWNAVISLGGAAAIAFLTLKGRRG